MKVGKLPLHFVEFCPVAYNKEGNRTKLPVP
jgi:hypothetical protein